MSFKPVRLLATLLAVMACSPGADIEPGAVPATLVMWNEDGVTTVRADVTDNLEVTGSVSQVTPGPNGELAWTSLSSDQATAAIVFDGANSESIESSVAPFFFHWSPSGDRLAFLGNSSEGDGLTFGILTVGEAEIRPTAAPSPFFFDWSPDGSQLVAHVGGSSVGVIDANTGDISDLGVEARIFPAPSWTDRGILVVSELGPSIDARENPVLFQNVLASVVLIDPADGTSVELANVDSPTRLFPGTLHVAIVVGAPGRQTIELIDWLGEPVATIGSGTIDVVQWSPDGSRLLWTERLADERLAPYTWSTDGIVDFDPFVPSPTFATTYLPFWDQYDRAISLWSHDSGRFALATSGEGGGEIVVHGAGETAVYPGFEMAAWSPDDFESRADSIESDS